MEQCPICGYKETIANRRLTNQMSHYIDEKTKKHTICLNDNDDFVTIKGVLYRRKGFEGVAPNTLPSQKEAQVVVTSKPIPTLIKPSVELKTPAPKQEEPVKA